MSRNIPNLTEISNFGACRALHRLINPFEKVMVYWNLHKKCFSVKQKGKVLAHTGYVELFYPSYRVSQSGRNRVLREQRKNVHAYVVGYVAKTPSTSIFFGNIKIVRYDPYKNKSFVRLEDGNWVETQNSSSCKMFVDTSQRPIIFAHY